MIQGERRCGFTLIELLVVIFVIGALLALILPAVQQAREAARRVQCATHLKNIGVALHQHVDAHGTFPAGVGDRVLESYLVHLLPYLERQALYDSINLPGQEVPVPVVNSADGKAIYHVPPIFRCPSDPLQPSSFSTCAASYPANAGRGFDIRGDGPFILGPLQPRKIEDGLSHTVGVTEWVVGSGTVHIPGFSDRGDRRGSIYNVKQLVGLNDQDGFDRLCASLPPKLSTPRPPGFKGMFWTMSGLGATQYNHELPPNRPSCIPAYAPEGAYAPADVVSAGSFHTGGANALTMDGAVRFVNESIDPHVWAAVGSRSGSEIVDGEAWD